LEEIVAAPDWKTDNTAVGIRCADHAIPSVLKKLALISSASGGRSSNASEFSFSLVYFHIVRVDIPTAYTPSYSMFTDFLRIAPPPSSW
jgi:hypothetical protein